MSRTYRRMKGNTPAWLDPEWYAEWHNCPVKEVLPKYHSDNSKAWCMSTPSWWIHEYHTKPERAQTRALIQKVKKLQDYEDCPEFPLDKKPHHYYW